MKRLLILLALMASVSYADTNTVDLTLIENQLTAINTYLQTWNKEFTNQNQLNTLKRYVYQTQTAVYTIRNYLDGSSTSSLFQGWEGIWREIADELSTVNTTLAEIASDSSDIAYDVDIINTRLYTCQQTLSNIYSMLSGISITLNQILAYSRSLPQIEAYQQSLALIVSNINNIVSDVGVTVNFPSPFNVTVDNFSDVNFNPAWDWQLKNIYGTGEPPSETLVWQNSLDLSDNRSTRFQLFPDMHNDTTFASWAGMLYKGLDNGFESLSSSGVRSVLLLNSISNINAQIYDLLSSLSPNTNLLATTEEQSEAASALRSEKLTTDSLTSEISSIDYTPNVYSESVPNIDSRPRLSGVVSAHDYLSDTASFNLGIGGFFQTATDSGYTQFAHPDSTITLNMRPVNDICICIRQVVLLVFWLITIFLGAKLCMVVYSLYQTIWVSLMSSDSDIGAGQTVNTIHFMRYILP